MVFLRLRVIAVLVAAGLLSGCAGSRAAVKTGYDFGKIRTVRVGQFTSPVNFTNAGSVAASEFVRQLLRAGYSVVTEAGEQADAVITGDVYEFRPTRRYLVGTNRRGEEVIIGGRGRRDGYDLGPAYGPNERIVVSNATVGVSAYLKDARTGEVVWSNAYSYEGLDVNAALEGAVTYLLHTLPSSIPSDRR